MAPPPPMKLEVLGLHKRYGPVEVLKGVDLRARAGDVTAVIGAEGRTMVVVTHEMGFASDVANHVVFLHQGVVEEEGDPRQVLAQPKSERLRRFLSGKLK